MVTVAVVAALGQIADGLAYGLAVNGRELNPVAALLGPHLLTVKVAAALVLAIGAYALRGRAVVAWLAAVGWIGAASEVAAS